MVHEVLRDPWGMTAWLLALLLAPLPRPDVSAAPTPSWVEPLDPGRVAALADEDDVEIVGGLRRLLYDEQHRFLDGETVRYSARAWSVHTGLGVQEGSEIRIEFDPAFEALTVHAVEIWRDGVAQDRLELGAFRVVQLEDELEEGIYDGRQTALLFLRDVRPGDVVHYAYSLAGTNPAFPGHYLASTPLSAERTVARVRYRVLAAGGPEVRLASFGGAPQPVSKTWTDEQGIAWSSHVLELSSVPPVDLQAMPPSWHQDSPWVQASTFSSWAEVVRDELVLFTDDEDPSEDLRELARALRAAHADQDALALAALRYVQDDVRYLGLELGAAAFRPAPANEVLTRRYGDCKDKVLLLTELLELLEIRAHPALVNTSWGRAVDDFLPSPVVFDHVVVRIELADATHWVDPTDTQVGGRLGRHESPPYERALVVAPGSDGLTSVPQSGGSWTFVRKEYDLVDRAVAPSLRVETEHRAGSADLFRWSLAQFGPRELAESYLDYYREEHPSTMHPEGTPAAARVEVRDDMEANRIVVVERYAVPELWEEDPDGGLQTFFVSAQELYQALPVLPPEPWTHPVAIDHPSVFEQTVVVRFWKDWAVEEGRGSLENPAFRFSWSSAHDAATRTWTLSFAYESKADHVRAEDARRVLSDLDDVQLELTFEVSHDPGALARGLGLEGYGDLGRGVAWLFETFLALFAR